MNALVVAVTVAIGILLPVEAFHANSFDAIKGCKQYGNVLGYSDPLEYIPTKNLRQLGQTSKSKFFKVAIQGRAHGHIRFGSSLYPYDKEVIEIVIGGWNNQESAGRRQFRSASNQSKNEQLVKVQTPNILNLNRPTMFRVELFQDGAIQVRVDGQDQPFLSFKDTKKIPFNYMAFTKWDKDLIFFYDCPLDKNAKICYESGKIQNATLSTLNEPMLQAYGNRKAGNETFYVTD